MKSRIDWIVAAVVVSMGFVAATPAWAQLPASSWPDYGAGNANTHRATAGGPGGNIHPVWVYQIPQPVGGSNYAHSQATIASDGALCFATYGSSFSSVIVLNPNGTSRWQLNQSALGRWVTPDIAGHLVHTFWSGGGIHSVFERSVADGTLIWRYDGYPGSYDMQSSAAIAPDGTIYASNDNGDLKAFSSAGVLKWSVAGAGGPYSNPAITVDGTVIAGGYSLRAITPAGASLWSYPADPGGAYFASPAIDAGGNIYAGESTVNKIVSFTPAGAVRWTRNGIGGAASIGPDGTIYAGYLGSIYALDPATGNTQWSYASGDIDEFGAEGITLDAIGNLYFSTVAGHVLSLNSLGQLRWDYDLHPGDPSNIWPSAPVLGASGTIYVGGGYTGKIFALVPEPAAPALLLLSAAAMMLYRARGARRARAH